MPSRRPRAQFLASARGTALVLGVAVALLVAAVRSGQGLSGGAPPEIAADANTRWWGALAQPGTDSRVAALALFDGKLVVAGTFNRAGGVLVRRVVAWDGAGWRKLGPGIPEGALAASVHNDELVVAGYRWDGTNWQALGGGIHGVYALASFNGELVAGGTFTEAGGQPANYIARWDGSSWQPLGLGLDATVRALAVFRGELVAGGDFLHAGGEAASHLARWDGSTWRPLGAGTSSAVHALLVRGNDLVAGGGFGYAGGAAASRVARWDGTRWYPYGAGRPNAVLALAEVGGSLVCGGNTIDVARWDGTSWVSLPVPLLGVRCLADYGGQIVAGGTFTEVAGLRLDNLARWDGTSWQPLHALGVGARDDTTAVAVRATALFDGEVVAAGEFGRAGGVACTRVAAWNGTRWHPLGEGLDGPVHALAAHGGALVAGGNFARAGTVPTPYLAGWDGSRWAALGPALDGPVHALLTWQGDLIAGGDFQHAGGTPAHNIARWNGTSWNAYDIGTDGTVRALAVYRDTLVAAGEFAWASGNPVRGIAKWDGDEWQPLGPGLGTLYALAVWGNELVAGGSFNVIYTSTPARGVARWDGRWWRPLNTSAGGTVYALATQGSMLFVGGSLDFNGAPCGGLLRYVPSSWDSLGSGLGTNTGNRDGVARALLVDGPRLWVGGDFVLAGRKTSSYLGRWTLTTVPVTVEDLEVSSSGSGVRLTWHLPAASLADLASLHVQRAEDEAGPFAAVSAPLVPPAAQMSFDDPSVEPGRIYWYRLLLVERDGAVSLSAPVRITAFTGVAHTAILDVHQPSGGGPVAIRFALGSSAPYRIALYDVRGRRLRTLAAASGAPGENLKYWDLRNDAGRPVGRGVYFVQLVAAGATSTRKLVLLHH